MVSKARDDLPDPLRPVITVNVFRGISTEIFLRLCWRAPRTVMLLIAMGPEAASEAGRNTSPYTNAAIQTGPGGCRAILLSYLSSHWRTGSMRDKNDICVVISGLGPQRKEM